MNDDLNDALSKAFDQVEEANAAEPATADVAEAPESVPAQPEERTADDRARDEQGRFAKAEEKKRETLTLKGKQNATKEQERPKEDEASAAQAATGSNPDNRGGDPAKGMPISAGTPIPPPSHWLGAAKKHWDRLPLEVRESIAQDGQQFAQTQGLNQALAPYSQVLTREFGGTDRGLSAILNTWGYARERPLDFVREFMQHRGIDPRMLAGETPQAQPSQVEDVPLPPAVIQRIQQLEAAVQTVQQQPLIAQQNQIQSEVESFGNAISADGKVAHPYFNDVKPAMAALMGSGQAKTLQEAYDAAVWANPTTRAHMLAAEQAQQAEQRRRAAEAAKGAAASIAGSPGHSGPGKAQTETVDATLERAWERAVSGARA